MGTLPSSDAVRGCTRSMYGDLGSRNSSMNVTDFVLHISPPNFDFAQFEIATTTLPAVSFRFVTANRTSKPPFLAVTDIIVLLYHLESDVSLKTHCLPVPEFSDHVSHNVSNATKTPIFDVSFVSASIVTNTSTGSVLWAIIAFGYT